MLMCTSTYRMKHNMALKLEMSICAGAIVKYAVPRHTEIYHLEKIARSLGFISLEITISYESG